MVQLEYAECLHFLFASWGEKICSKVQRTSFVAIDSVSEVTMLPGERSGWTSGEASE